MIKVRVPATSANLGVGYDCLGLALDDFATVTFEVIAEGLEIAGCEEAYCNEENLFYQAFLKGLQYMGERVPGIRITVETDIPYARGLGSSATCIVAGLAGANALFHNRMNAMSFSIWQHRWRDIRITLLRLSLVVCVYPLWKTESRI